MEVQRKPSALAESLHRQARDIAQRFKQPVSLEDVLAEIVPAYLRKEDPLEIAKRQNIRGKLVASSVHEQSQEAPERSDATGVISPVVQSPNFEAGQPQQLGPGPVTIISTAKSREPIPAALKHKVRLKFNGQCAHVDRDGKRCMNKKFLDFHHIVRICDGGRNELENLQLLCAGHHKMHHARSD